MCQSVLRKGWFLFQLSTTAADNSSSIFADDLLSEISCHFHVDEEKKICRLLALLTMVACLFVGNV